MDHKQHSTDPFNNYVMNTIFPWSGSLPYEEKQKGNMLIIHENVTHKAKKICDIIIKRVFNSIL